MDPQIEQEKSDAELLRAVAHGDEHAFASLYDRYSAILLGLLLRILHRRSEAEDVLQEVFLQVWQKAADFDEQRGRAFTWLVTLARSRAIDRLRSVESRDRTVVRAAQETTETIVEADQEAIKSQEGHVIRAALAEIPAEQQRTLMLAYFEGLTQSEIAARLGEPLGTIKTRTRSGLIKLREMLHGKF